MPKAQTPTHIVEFPLRARRQDVRRVGVRLDALRQIGNAVLGEGLKRLNRVRDDADFQAALAALRAARKAGDKAAVKRIQRELAAIEKAHGLTEYDLQALATQHKNACWFADHLDAHSPQKMATRVWKSLREYQFGRRGKPRFKSWRRGIDSAEGKAKSCLTVKIGDTKKLTRFCWKGLELPLKTHRNDKHGYEAHALGLIADGQWKYCRIIRRAVRGEPRLFVQVALVGEAYVKSKHEALYAQGKGQIAGIDLGPSTVAAVSGAKALLTQLCPELDDLNAEIGRLQRQNARRLRLANPQNFSSHQKRRGRKTLTVFKMKKGAHSWQRSQAWRDTQAEIAELQRRMAAQRKQQHEILANQILALGNTVAGEKLSYKAWQKRFGRSVGHRAPASLVSTIQRKVAKTGTEWKNIDPYTAKLSQFDHTDQTFTKKKLSEREMILSSGDWVQRDLYSAFLASVIDNAGKAVCMGQAHRAWPSARQALDAAMQAVIQDANGSALPASLGAREYRVHLGRSVSQRESHEAINEHSGGCAA